MATHSSVLAWRIPGTGEPGRLPSLGSHRVWHDWSDLAAAAALWKKCYNKPWQPVKMQRYHFSNKYPSSQSLVFPVAMYGYESWTIKNTEHQRTAAFKLWCWRRLLRVPWTASQSDKPKENLKENPPQIFIGRTDAEAQYFPILSNILLYPMQILIEIGTSFIMLMLFRCIIMFSFLLNLVFENACHVCWWLFIYMLNI